MNTLPPPPWVLFVTQLIVILPILGVGTVLGLTVITWSQTGARAAIVGPLLGGCGGTLIGYFTGAVVACRWLWPASNTCGLAAVFVTAPAAAIIGALIGWRAMRRRGA